MLKLIRSSQYKVMPWKNGEGTTSEIEISPDDAVIANNDFAWRLSSATVKASSPFSMFPGYERILVVWKGEGLVLNGLRHESQAPFHFSGEIPLDCAPIGEEVTDLGVIYRRGQVKATMNLKIFAPKALAQPFSVSEGLHFLFCTKGIFKVGDLEVQTGDTLKIQGAYKVPVETNQGASCFYVHIQE